MHIKKVSVKKVFVLFILVIVISAAGCSENRDNREDSVMDNEELITTEELVKSSSIEQGEYDTGLLDSFIKEYKITKENVSGLNIALLLSEYKSSMKIKDVSGIFNNEKPKRQSDFINGIKAIAYIENDGTSLYCAYLDLEENLLYSSDEASFFNDISKGYVEEITDDSIPDRLEEAGVFDIDDSTDYNEDFEDGRCICIAVSYSDDSVFIRYYSDDSDRDFYDKYDVFKEIMHN